LASRSGNFAAVDHDIRVLTEPDELWRALEVFCASVVDLPVPTGGEITDYSEPGRTFGAFVDGTSSSHPTGCPSPGPCSEYPRKARYT
jgi:hypothetical protein